MDPSRAATCSISGGQTLRQADFSAIQEFLNDALSRLLRQGVTCFQTGGNRGFDTFAALAVLQRKLVYPQLKLSLLLPCKEQTRGWSQRETALYCAIVRQADELRFTAEHSFEGCLQKRDRALVDSAGQLICCPTDGTEQERYILDYARLKEVPVLLFSAGASEGRSTDIV